MNNTRRKNLSRAINLIENAYSIIDFVRDQEMECYDNIPENLQNSERSIIIEDIIDTLEEHLDTLSDITEYLESL